ncbi:COG4648 family protein [Thalassotalea litorea]|uniref:COG4648 family protein n=1 Tax=Thalassotalea litorea TaxID=2020715 RepID=UPI003735234E
MKILLTIVIASLLIAYPIAIYLGLQYLQPRILAVVFIAILVVRLWLSKGLVKRIPWLVPTSILGVAVLTVTALINDQGLLLFYPVVINLTLFAVFSFSLIQKPCVIEMLARIKEPDLPAQGVLYTEQVTKAWCIFFLINAGIAWYTAIYSSIEVWSMYNGFIAYLLVALIIAIEFLVRLYVRKRNEHAA